ncbi:MAG TPA: aldose 1-epimerase [Bryobacteraceae bacterium]|nr:aldose 1-epimerase [Bryobacteraceae bacterium]
MLSLTAMAQASNYSAEKQVVEGIEVVRLADTAHHIEVSICPSVGNIAFDLRVNGQPILMPPPAGLAEWKAQPAQTGIPFLAPWANRMDPDSFWANGRKYVLNPDAADLRRDANGLAIHGLLLFASGWQVIKLNAGDDSAEVVSRLEFWRHAEWMSQFPFAHSIEIRYRLSNGTLEVRTTIHNEGRDPMPLLIGFHPWYQIPGVPRDNWKLHLPVRDHYTLSSKSVPTGEKTSSDLPDPLPLAGRQLDDVFGGVNSSDEFWVEGGGQRISVRFGPKFPVAVIYAPKDRNVVCFEPMTAVTNAFNLAHAGLYKSLQSIAPGASWSESFWIRPSGF